MGNLVFFGFFCAGLACLVGLFGIKWRKNPLMLTAFEQSFKIIMVTGMSCAVLGFLGLLLSAGHHVTASGH